MTVMLVEMRVRLTAGVNRMCFGFGEK